AFGLHVSLRRHAATRAMDRRDLPADPFPAPDPRHHVAWRGPWRTVVRTAVTAGFRGRHSRHRDTPPAQEPGLTWCAIRPRKNPGACTCSNAAAAAITPASPMISMRATWRMKGRGARYTR